jgi:hypothetical protein
MGHAKRVILAGAGIASALLIGASAGVGSATAATASSGMRAKAGGCAAFAKHTFFAVVSARHAARGAVVLTGHRAKVICGGPDDWHFQDAKATVTAHVPSSAHVQILTTTNAGIGAKKIRPSQLVSFLPHDVFTRTFQVTGPLNKVSSLTEIFHP